jgi:hypothetical protein
MPTCSFKQVKKASQQMTDVVVRGTTALRHVAMIRLIRLPRHGGPFHPEWDGIENSALFHGILPIRRRETESTLCMAASLNRGQTGF